MHSPDLVSSSPQTQFEYPRQQQSEKMHYTFMLHLLSLAWRGCSSSVSQSRTVWDVCTSQLQKKEKHTDLPRRREDEARPIRCWRCLRSMRPWEIPKCRAASIAVTRQSSVMFNAFSDTVTLVLLTVSTKLPPYAANLQYSNLCLMAKSDSKAGSGFTFF